MYIQSYCLFESELQRHTAHDIDIWINSIAFWLWGLTNVGLCGFSWGCSFGLFFVCEYQLAFTLKELFILIGMSYGIESDVNVLLVV